MNTSIGEEVAKLYKKELTGPNAQKSDQDSVWKTIALIQVVVLVVGLATVMFVHYFNKFAAVQQEVYAAGSIIEKEYARRNSLVPKMAGIAREYAEYERDITRFIADVRTLKMLSEGPLSQSNPGVEKALSKLVALTEQYPDLKATENFQGLMEKVENTENRITTARSVYVKFLNEYNNLTQTFPDNIFAGIYQFKKFPLYKSEADPRPVRDERIFFNSIWWNWLRMIQLDNTTKKNSTTGNYGYGN